MSEQRSVWKHKSTFILATAGAAIGLGNIWKFPYMTASNGGSAFVLIYIACVFLIGLPIMVSETIIGKYARGNAVMAIKETAIASNASKYWSSIALIGFFALFLLFSFYSVIAGWSIDYTFTFLQGNFTGKSGSEVSSMFGDLLASIPRLTIWHTVFMCMTVYIITKGVKGGIEKSLQIMMPTLAILLFAMVLYGMIATDQFPRAISYLFSPDFSKVTPDMVISAMGQAFFSLSLGMCVVMTYASYMREDVFIVKSTITIVLLDTSIALLAGLAIFPVVFEHGLEVSNGGPGLLFVTLSTAFAQIPFGRLIGAAFFFLIFIAAISSSISMIEPIVRLVIEKYKISRIRFTLIYSFIVWLFGMITVFSFNIWEDVDVLGLGKNPFEVIDYLFSNILLPIGGLLIAIYSGWILDKRISRQELLDSGNVIFMIWSFAIKYISPVAIIVILISVI